MDYDRQEDAATNIPPTIRVGLGGVTQGPQRADVPTIPIVTHGIERIENAMERAESFLGLNLQTADKNPSPSGRLNVMAERLLQLALRLEKIGDELGKL